MGHFCRSATSSTKYQRPVEQRPVRYSARTLLLVILGSTQLSRSSPVPGSSPPLCRPTRWPKPAIEAHSVQRSARVACLPTGIHLNVCGCRLGRAARSRISLQPQMQGLAIAALASNPADPRKCFWDAIVYASFLFKRRTSATAQQGAFGGRLHHQQEPSRAPGWVQRKGCACLLWL